MKAGPIGLKLFPPDEADERQKKDSLVVIGSPSNRSFHYLCSLDAALLEQAAAVELSEGEKQISRSGYSRFIHCEPATRDAHNAIGKSTYCK